MEKGGDWFGLISEHTKRQSDLANFQIVVSVGFAGFIWSGKIPVNTILVLFFIYLAFAIYITYSIYKIQVRRFLLWRILAIKENLDSHILEKDEGLFKKVAKVCRRRDSFYYENDPQKIQALYIKKIKPSERRMVLGLHVCADICALLIILLYILK